MHKYFPTVYCFIDEFNTKELIKINKSINIIYRNYRKKTDIKILLLLKNYCRRKKQKIFLANNFKLAKNLKLDGVYFPSFNKILNTKNISIPNNFEIIGSAHNLADIKIKEKQGCKIIFLAPIFKVKKKTNYLDVVNFNKLSIGINNKIIALGGINSKNLKRLNLLKCDGYAEISWVKKNGLKVNSGRF